MTEYKKLLGLMDELGKITADLSAALPEVARATALERENRANEKDGESAETAPQEVPPPPALVFAPELAPQVQEWYQRSSRGQELVHNANPRMEKMLARAREKDPDKQIYNETMCQKVEDMVAQYGEMVPLFEAFTDPVEELYFACVEWEAQSRAFQQRTETEVGGIVVSEEKCRILIRQEEKRAYQAAVEDARKGLHSILEAERIQAEARWTTEQSRRQQEQAALLQSVLPEGLSASQSVKNHLNQLRETAAADHCDGLGLETKKVVHALHVLVDELYRRPEEEGIRSLRNNNESFLADFGHPGFVLQQSGETATATVALVEGRGSEWLVYPHAEAILTAVGYRLHYTRVPVPAPPSPHGAVYRPLGYEPYGERTFVLQEPNAIEQSEQWIEWFQELEIIREMLSEMDDILSGRL